MKTPTKIELSSSKYINEGLLYMLWKLTRVDYTDTKGLFEFMFEYVKPFDWDTAKTARSLQGIANQFGITLQNPRFEDGYFKDTYPKAWEEITSFTEHELKTKGNDISEKFFHKKERLATRQKILNGQPITMDDMHWLLLDFMPINFEASLLDGTWFEIRVSEKARKEIKQFLDDYLKNFIDNKLTGQPQDFSQSLIKPQNFYTFEKHHSDTRFRLENMHDKYGDRFIITGLIDKDPEFLHIHFLLALEKLGLIKIHRLGTNSGAYTHGDDPQWEADITLQENYNDLSMLKKKIGPSLGSKKREWVEFFKKMDVVIEGEDLLEKLNEEGDSFGSVTRSLLERTDMVMCEVPSELKKLNWVFEEYNSTPYSLEKSKAIILSSLDKLSDKYEQIPLVYTTLPFPSYVNFSSEVWREIASINSFEKQDYGHIDFLNALAALAAEKIISILFFETLWLNKETLVFKATIIGYKKDTTPQPAISSKVEFDIEKGLLKYNGKNCQIPINTNQYFLCKKVFQEPRGKRVKEIEILNLIDWEKDSPRSVYDAMRAVNKKAKNDLKHPKLFEWLNNHIWLKE